MDFNLFLKYCRRQCTLLPSTQAKSPTKFNPKMQHFKDILLEIGFVEEMRTTYDNEEVPQIFLRKPLSSRKYNLLRLTPYKFVTSHKA